MARSHDIIIIGAGIVGSACAWRLAHDGRRVLVIDAGGIGAGATAAGMGHVVAMDDSDAQFDLTRYSQRLWDDLAPEMPPGGEYVRCGTIWAAADDEEFAAVEPKAEFYRRRHTPAEILDARELYRREPNLRPGLVGGLLVPGDSVVYPPPIAAWMLERAVERGGEVRLRTRVRSIDPAGSVSLDDGTRLDADVIINACGSWSPELTPGIPVRRRKGHLAITDRYPGFCTHQLIELGYLKNAHASDADSVSFNLQPRATGQVLIGSSRQFDPVDGGTVRPLGPEVDHAMLARMIRRAIEYMPGLADLKTIRVWTGFRAATPDSLPLIGPAADGSRLWLAAGHEGLGITTSLGTAWLMADLLAGRAPAIDPTPYSPARAFAGH
jgi:D-hydroxyproline dehydrogenase subunit beta